jgi:ribosomal protein L7/L12
MNSGARMRADAMLYLTTSSFDGRLIGLVSASHAQPPDRGDYRLLVRSIGSADAAVIGALRRLRKGSDTQLAELLYRAPSELMHGLDRTTGTKLCDVLRETGIDVALVADGDAYEPGSAEYEVALVITRVDRLLAVVRETMRVLGVNADTAKRLVCANPAVILGRISRATVEALRRRYEPLGVDLDVSRSADAEFDVAAESTDELTLQRLERWLEDEGIATAVSGTGQILATGLKAPTAERIWDKFRANGARIRLLNRDFQRFDVRVDSAPGPDDPARPQLLEWLQSARGIPEAAAARALSHTPFVLAENVAGEEMVALLHEIRARGGRATAILLALQGFSLAVNAGGDRRAARARIEAIAGTGCTPPPGFDRGIATTLDGPFTKTQARWLQHELRVAGVRSALVER